MIKASQAEVEDSLARMEAATDVFAKEVSQAVLDETNGFFMAVELATRQRNTLEPLTRQ